jgi:hypothetical protein
MADPFPANLEPLAEYLALLRFLGGEIYAHEDEINDAIEEGFRRAYPEPPSAEDNSRIKRAPLKRLCVSIPSEARRHQLWRGGLEIVRNVSEADAVRMQVEEYFRRSIARIVESA